MSPRLLRLHPQSLGGCLLQAPFLFIYEWRASRALTLCPLTRAGGSSCSAARSTARVPRLSFAAASFDAWVAGSNSAARASSCRHRVAGARSRFSALRRGSSAIFLCARSRPDGARAASGTRATMTRRTAPAPQHPSQGSGRKAPCADPGPPQLDDNKCGRRGGGCTKACLSWSTARSAADYAAHFRAAQLSAGCRQLRPAVSVALLRALRRAGATARGKGSARRARAGGGGDDAVRALRRRRAQPPARRRARGAGGPRGAAARRRRRPRRLSARRPPRRAARRVQRLRLRRAPLARLRRVVRQLVEKLRGRRPPRPRHRRLVTVGFGLELVRRELRGRAWR